MAKKISINKPAGKAVPTTISPNTRKSEAGKLVDLNFKVSPEFKKEFKQLALDLESNQKQILERAILLLKQNAK